MRNNIRDSNVLVEREKFSEIQKWKSWSSILQTETSAARWYMVIAQTIWRWRFSFGVCFKMQGTIVFESVRVLRHTVTCIVNDRTTLCTRCSCSCRIIFNPQCRGNVSHHYSIRSQRIVTMKTRVEMCRSKGWKWYLSIIQCNQALHKQAVKKSRAWNKFKCCWVPLESNGRGTIVSCEVFAYH